ncbi:MAG: TrkH family potassium uptake protein [Planctomycetota bacterium]
MRRAAVASICGLLLMTLGGTLLAPLGIAYLFDSQEEIPALWKSIAITFFVGAMLFFGFRRDRSELGGREGFAIVALGWTILSAFAALPFYLAPNGIPSYLDAYFETMSGFSTTGASILTDIEALPKGLLFWRSMTHWLGGMGIVVLTVAILPFLGAGGYQIFRAEVPGPTADKLKPRIAQTAKILWSVYLALTLIEIGLLLPVMSWYDATCHAFGTLATGGFSTLNGSVADYSSVYVDTVMTIFMILAGANFVLHFRFATGHGFSHLINAEFRVYFGIIIVGALVITGFLYLSEFPDKAVGVNEAKYESWGSCFRYAIFQVSAIVTTTGFVTADFDAWPNPCRAILALLMVFGGCAGSTGGGVKVIRILVLVKYGVREVHRLIRPHEVAPVKVGGENIEREVVARVMGFMSLYLVLFFLAVMTMSIILHFQPMLENANTLRPDQDRTMITSFGSVLATFGNVGPGFADVGPVENFAGVPSLGKALLILCMLMGRLEIYAVIVLFVPLMWRR